MWITMKSVYIVVSQTHTTLQPQATTNLLRQDRFVFSRV
jgi:hypothetical protein